MTARAPPRLATWLLETLSSGSHAEALIGDLDEQFGAGRSRWWYWQQAIGALVLDLTRTLRTHGLSFATAVLCGYASTWLWRVANALAPTGIAGALEPTPHTLSLDTLGQFLALHTSQTMRTALVFVSVWIVTHIHRAHPRAALIAFVLTLTVPRLAGLTQLVTDGMANSRLPPALIPQIIQTSLQAIFTLAAGLWVIRKERFLDMPARARFLAIITLAIALVSCALYDAWKVGALTYPASLRYPVDAIEIACGAYLTLLLWRSNSAFTRACRSSLNGGIP